jgi:hypothetical protein
MGSAGTDTQVTINGSGFGSSQGSVSFFYKDTGDSASTAVAADVISWSDTRVVCTVPICDWFAGECGGYGGGASSGPVTVTTSGGGMSNSAVFEVSFGFGGSGWNPPQINYYIATSVPAAFSAALQNAGATWTSAAGIGFTYSGSTNASVTSQNGITEMVYGPLPPGTDSGVIAYAMCWSQGGTISECDILFNSAKPFSTSTPTPTGNIDVETIALHEFGHWLRLLDLYGNLAGFPSDTAKVMYGFNSGGPNWMKRTLHPDDLAGVRWIYGTNSCTFSISPTSTSIAAAGGSGNITVTTQTGCSWTASSDAPWLTITNGTSGTGSNTINYSASSNSTTSSRTGHITAGGRTFTLTQEAAPVCAYFISPTSRTHPSESESGTISVTSATGCAWTATTSTGWIHITSGSSGSGNGTVVYRVDANSSTSQRSGSLLVAGRTFTVTQSGVASCSYTISPTSQSFGPSAGTGSVTVSTTSGCSWSASLGATWVSITSGSSGSSSGTVSYMVTANTSTSSRSTSLSIAGRQFSISQSGTSGGSSSSSYLVAGIAHAPGAGGSSWRSTLAVTNTSSQAANLTITYQYGGTTTTRTIVLSGNAIREWDDVASSLFGQSGSTSGSILVASDLPVMVTARTYNATLGGTFGQYLPGAESATAIASGQMGMLPQIKKVSGYRTNVGFINLGSANVTIRTRLYSEDGFPLGNDISTNVAATEWKQVNDVFNAAGISSCDIGYATVELTSGAGPFWAYASVVDNASGDPTTIPVFLK